MGWLVNENPPKVVPPQKEGVEIASLVIYPQGINISHLGKRKIIFKMPFWGDMLVPWRVINPDHKALCLGGVTEKRGGEVDNILMMRFFGSLSLETSKLIHYHFLIIWCYDPWSFLVPLIYNHPIGQYIPPIYCQLGDYMSPTSY